jgi:2-methylcitrate dehydratase PrpD
MAISSNTAAILAFAQGHHALPADVQAACATFLMDTLGCGLAGSSAPGAAGVLATARAMGEGGAARILGHGNLALPAPGAAFANAFSIHCLEWDAVHEPAVVHALSVVTAALLAAVDRERAAGRSTSPEALMQALAVGVDVASGLGIAARTGLRFFRPATAGVIGAALAVARISGLDAAAFPDVLGLAYSQVAGTMQAHVEGSIALPLQIAVAARAAVTAVDLVRHGLTGPHDVLEGPFGYFTLIEQAGDLSEYVAGLGRVWRIAEISHKPYPSGRASHAVLSVLEAWRAQGVRPDQIARITAFVPPLIARLVGRPWRPDMGTAYARLCLPFLSALMLTDGAIDPRRFTAEAFADPGLRALGDRLTVTVDGNPDPNALSPQRVELALHDGTTLVQDVPATLGAPAKPFGRAQQEAKLQLCNSLAVVPLDDPELARLRTDPFGWVLAP